MISNGWFLGLEVAVAVSIFRRLLLISDPNTKRIAYLGRRVSELFKQLGIEEAPLTEVQTLIAQGRKINAIKLYREQTGVGLREAKEAVDALEAQMNALNLA